MATFDTNTFDTSLYLSSARRAVEEGRFALAFHLYLAAYEVSCGDDEDAVPSDEVLAGLREAWRIALDAGEKAAAELAYVVIEPLVDDEEAAEMEQTLHDMMVEQLRDLGVTDEQLGQMPFMQPADEPQFEMPEFLNGLGMLMRGAVAGEQPLQQAAGAADGQAGSSQPEERGYTSLVGYDTALKSMCAYGFDSGGDEAYRQFVHETSEFHGLAGHTLADPFLFHGPSREDVFEFAQATAAEIGNPAFVLHVRTNDEGVWTIRLSGPFRRGLFGMSDPTDLPTPCTFIIENIDILQDFIQMAIDNERRGGGETAAQGGRMHAEILGYIHAIVHKPGVFTILTARERTDLKGPFAELFGQCERILVDNPTVEERHDVWSNFALEHTSFSEVDIDRLSTLSEGISRHNLIVAGESAVKDAYQESLSSNDYRFVSLNDVLFEMVPFASDGEKLNSAIEDAAAEAFVSELDDLSFSDRS